MGLFGNRKNKNNVTVASINEEQLEDPSLNSYDQINEQAEVVERAEENTTLASQTEAKIGAETTEQKAHPSEYSAAQPNEQREEDHEEERRSFISFNEKPPVNHIIGQTKILAIINQKGGVGKSTTAINLAAALGALNKEVLLVDLDPQGNATSGFGIDNRALEKCIYDVLLGDTPSEEVILSGITQGVDVMPSTINLAGAEVELVSEMARENRLKNALGSLRGLYDYILIDCPPSLGLLTINALVAADKLLVPIQCEFYALEGVTKLLESMNRVKKMLNPSLSIFGIVMTMHDSRTKLSNEVVNNVREYFGDLVFDTLIPRTVRLSEAPSYGQSIIEFAPTNKGAQAYTDLAQEVITRG